MKVSIITATYNSAATLRDTLDSVLAQTYQDIEYIIVDGLSADGTQEIVKAYEPRFGGRLRLVSEKDKGLYDAMNKGLRMATGDIVGVLNSDDLFYDKQVVADVVKAFESDDIDCVYGDLEFVAANDITKVVRKWKGSQYQPGYFKRGWHPAHPTFYCRRACYEKYGYFDLDLKVSADFDLMLRFLGNTKYATNISRAISSGCAQAEKATGRCGESSKATPTSCALSGRTDMTSTASISCADSRRKCGTS